VKDDDYDDYYEDDEVYDDGEVLLLLIRIRSYVIPLWENGCLCYTPIHNSFI
jgi:hypothetical protein